MKAELNSAAKDHFATEFLGAALGFVRKKSLKAFVPGAAVFERSYGETRQWVAFGGFKDSYFGLFAAWGSADVTPSQLPEWERGAIPAMGFVDLRNRHLVDPKEGSGAFFSFDLPEPEEALQEKVFAAYARSAQCAKDIESSYAGMLRLNRSKPISFEEHRREALVAERAYCKLWAHLLSRHTFSEAELRTFVSVPVASAVRVALEVGIPFLERVSAAGAQQQVPADVPASAARRQGRG